MLINYLLTNAIHERTQKMILLIYKRELTKTLANCILMLHKINRRLMNLWDLKGGVGFGSLRYRAFKLLNLDHSIIKFRSFFNCGTNLKNGLML